MSRSSRERIRRPPVVSAKRLEVRRPRRELIAVLAIIAVVAIAGGVELVATSSGHMLRRPFVLELVSPFVSFEATGVMLAVLVGGSHAIAAVLLLRRHERARAAAWVAALIPLGWGMLQVLVLGGVTWFQLSLMGVGAIEVLLSAASTPRATRR